MLHQISAMVFIQNNFFIRTVAFKGSEDGYYSRAI